MRRESKHIITKNQLNLKQESSKRGTKLQNLQKTIKKKKGNSKSFLISNYFKCKGIKHTKQKTWIGCTDFFF